MDNAGNKTLSGKVIRLQIQIKNDALTHPNLTNIEWKDFGDLKAAFENNKRFGEKVWKQNVFLEKFFLRKSLRNYISVSVSLD